VIHVVSQQKKYGPTSRRMLWRSTTSERTGPSKLRAAGMASQHLTLNGSSQGLTIRQVRRRISVETHYKSFKAQSCHFPQFRLPQLRPVTPPQISRCDSEIILHVRLQSVSSCLWTCTCRPRRKGLGYTLILRSTSVSPVFSPRSPFYFLVSFRHSPCLMRYLVSL